MNEYINMAAAFAAGTLTGALFFGGLWLTTRKGIASKTPALWFIGSFLLRTAVTLAAFYYISDGSWKRLLACLLGFIAARMLVKRLLPVSGVKAVQIKKEA